MPSKSKKQARFMAAAANNPRFAKKAGISVDVAKEFNDADAGGKYSGKGKRGSNAKSRTGKTRSWSGK